MHQKALWPKIDCSVDAKGRKPVSNPAPLSVFLKGTVGM